MDRYVDVRGQATFTEHASRFVTEVGLEVRATKQEAAIEEVSELWREVIATLRESKIENEEIIEGGTDYQHPWFWKRKVAKTAGRKIILKVADFERLSAALEVLEPLQTGERKTISIAMRQPEFDADADTRADALASAFADARSKARRLAVEMGLRLGRVIRLEEGRWSHRPSGFMGDEDWSGDDGRFDLDGDRTALDAETGNGEDLARLQNPSREIFVTCRARFALVE